MQIELIDTFLDLCETKSFNQTADRLGVTQSTVSSRVRALERTVEKRLFQRSRAGTALTTEGLRFEPHARGLRHSWTKALNATRDSALGGVTMRIGLQHDLVSLDVRGLIAHFRTVLPETAILFEADYSGQICADLVSGAQDIAVLFTPKLQPDLFFDTLGEIDYVMVSTECDTLSDVAKSTYILANYAPAFSQTHAALLPDFEDVSLSIGQNGAMVDLLTSLSGTGYVLRNSAEMLVGSGKCRLVGGAPRITQPIFAGIHMRNRHRSAYRAMGKVVRSHFQEATQARRASD